MARRLRTTFVSCSAEGKSSDFGIVNDASIFGSRPTMPQRCHTPLLGGGKDSRPWAKIKPGGLRNQAWGASNLRLSLGTLRVPGRLRRPNYLTPFTWIVEPHLIDSM